MIGTSWAWLGLDQINEKDYDDNERDEVVDDELEDDEVELWDEEEDLELI